MEAEKIRDVGNGFALLPFGSHARNGEVATWSDTWLSVLTVLISFENRETRKSYPSFDTIAALGGVSKGSIGDTILQIQKNEWLTLAREPIGRGRHRYVYTMRYSPYSTSFGAGDGKDWISVYDDVIKSGVWAVMPPSARKLYLVMKAYTMEGFYANTGWTDPYTDAYADLRHDCAEDFDFMPASVLDRFGRERPTLANLCGLNDRTYRFAKNWLTDNQLMHFYEGDYYTGLAFPHKPNRFAPKVLETMENKKKVQGEAARRGCTGHAKKSLRAIKVRSKQAGQRGGDSRLKEIDAGGAATSVPLCSQ